MNFNSEYKRGFEFQAQKEHLDLGNVLVGDLQSCSVVLLNDGICSLTYILSVEQLITGPCDPEEVHSEPLGTVRQITWDGALVFPFFLQNHSSMHSEFGLLAGWLALVLLHALRCLLLCLGICYR